MALAKRIGIGLVLGAGLVAVAGAAYGQYRDRGEQPSYTVVKSEEPFELRDYDPIVVAEVTHEGSRNQASGRSFRRLAAYIFGQDRPKGGERIAMTSPVLQERVDQDASIAMTSPVLQEETGEDTWRMRFVMPAKYSLETLPAAPDDIALTEVPRRRLAAVTFSGNASDSDLDRMEAKLIAWLAANNLKPVGGFEYAFYDAPMVPGPLRRNEVLVEVEGG